MVYDYGSGSDFFSALLRYYKATGRFSVRQRLSGVDGCSPALVTQVLKGRRRLTRDQLPVFSKLFKLNQLEFDYLDQSLKAGKTVSYSKMPEIEDKPARKREAKNHILSSWFNLYVKDLVHLRGFAPDEKTLHRMLYGVLTPSQISRSIEFLLKEGFWRKDLKGRVHPEDEALLTTNEIPNEKIRAFHKQALKIALRGMDAFPVERRKASTILVSVDKDKVAELRDLVDQFQTRLLKFIDDNPGGKDELFQVAVHLTPVGGSHVDTK